MVVPHRDEAVFGQKAHEILIAVNMLGDPVDQTIDNPHEYHPTPTTINGMNQPILTPVVPPKTSTPSKTKPKTTKPSPTPVGLR